MLAALISGLQTPRYAYSGPLFIILIVAVVFVVNIILLKIIAAAITNSVIDVLEKRGYSPRKWP